jgi:hypothetical protein
MRHDAPIWSPAGRGISWTVVRETRKGDLECSLGGDDPLGRHRLVRGI